jgi:hypothetical protein
MRTLQQKANSFARKCGYGVATEIVIIDMDEPTIIRHTSFGYCKNTTGEYVPNSYMRKFGWKNCSYQHAETVVGIPKNWTY